MAADFSTVVDAVLLHNMADATRDKARLDQATSHNQKLVGRLDALSEKVDEGNERVADAFESNTEVQSEMLQNTDPDSSKNQEQINEENKRQEGLVAALQGVGERVSNLGKQAKDFVGKTPTFIQALLSGVGFFALAKLLQTDTAKGVFTTIINALIKFGKDIKELLNGTKGFIQVIFDNFLTILAIVTAIKPKMVFNLLKKGIMSLAGYFDKAVDFVQDGGLKKIFDGASKSFANFKQGFKNFALKLKIQSRMALNMDKYKGKGTFDKSIKAAFSNFTNSFSKGIDKFNDKMGKLGTGIVNTFKSIDKALSQPGGMKKLLNSARVAIAGYYASFKSAVIGAFIFLKGLVLANPLTAILVAVGAALAIIGSYFGFFDPLIDGIMNIFKKIKGFFVGIYNAFAESAIGRFLGLNPITDDEVVPEEGEPPDGTEGAGTNRGGADSVMQDSPATQEKEMTQREMVANALNKLAGQGDKPTVISNVTNAPNQSQSVTNTQNTAIVDRDFLIKSLTSMA
jgi:hypothetical protein